ncbi:MAG: DUF1858 domain-containing protein [bacterium]|nr:DUF1858 domain-containing protein [bacterium]
MKKSEKPKIHGKMKLGDVAVKYPETMEVFFKYGLHCIGCQGASFETIEEGATVHGMTDSEIEKLVNELNAVGGKRRG